MPDGLQIQGWKRGNLHEEATRVLGTQVGVEQDSDEWDSPIVTNESQRNRVGSLLFVNVKVSHRVLIQADAGIVVRWNSPTNPPFTIRPGESFEETRLEITDMYFTTSAVTTPIRVYLT